MRLITSQMRVILPPDLAPKSAYSHEFANYIDELPISTKETQWNAANQSLYFEYLNLKDTISI